MPNTLVPTREIERREAVFDAVPKERAGRNERVPALVFLAVGAFGAAWFVARNPFDTDGWWHLAGGDLMLDRGTLLRSDPFSWTAAGRPWRLSAWLYDVIVATLRELGGRAAVSVLALAAVIAFAFACYGLARRAGAAAWPSAQMATLATLMLAPFFAERAQMLSYLLFSATIALAPRALRGSNRCLLGLVALFVVWSNVHLIFVLGIGTVCLIALGTGLVARTWRRPAVVAASVAIAGLVNPYGARAYESSLRVRGASQTILEWRHATIGEPYDLILLALVALVALSLWRTGRWRRPDVTLPIVAMIVLTADAIRNGPFLTVLVAVELALGLTRLASSADKGPSNRVRVLAIGLTVLTLVAVLGFHGIRPASPIYPVRAAAAIPAGCRLLNEYEQGGYLIDDRWPDVLVSQDGRNDLYGDAELDRQERVLGAKPGWQRWLDTQGVGCVLAYRVRPIVTKLEALGWKRVATDPISVLLVRP